MSDLVLSSEALTERVGQILRARFGVLRAGVKRLAGIVGADPRSVKNWLSGTNAPQLNHAIDLMAADPELEEFIFAQVCRRREAMCRKSVSNSFSHSAGSASGSAAPTG